MALSEVEQRQADGFRQWTLALFEGDTRFERIVEVEHAGEGDGGYVVRFEVSRQSCYEVAFRPQEQTVRIGFLTQDRTLNESIERGILDSGDTLTEMIEIELEDMGEIGRYDMDHFFERPWFCFYTSLPLESMADLESDEFRLKVQHLLDACHIVFQEYVDEEKKF